MQTETQLETTFAQDTYLPILTDAFLVDRRAANMADGTLKFYHAKLTNFQAFCETQAITQIDQLTPSNIREYLIYLENTGHTSGGIHAHYRTVKTFLRWYADEFEPVNWRNPIAKVKPPKVEQELLEPANEGDLQAMLATCTGKSFADLRDKAIILTLMDTGLRANELVSLDLADIDLIRGDMLVRQGKGRKPRTVFVGKRTRKALRAYKLARTSTDSALFVTYEGERLEYEGLRAIIIRRAVKADVETPSLHSFRRYFALEYLRAGGDIFTLQKLMGHADLQILRRYLNQLDEDLERGHAQFGPVDRMR